MQNILRYETTFLFCFGFGEVLLSLMIGLEAVKMDFQTAINIFHKRQRVHHHLRALFWIKKLLY